MRLVATVPLNTPPELRALAEDVLGAVARARFVSVGSLMAICSVVCAMLLTVPGVTPSAALGVPTTALVALCLGALVTRFILLNIEKSRAGADVSREVRLGKARGLVIPGVVGVVLCCLSLWYLLPQVETKFGGMLNAFKYGAPPHGGIAPGIDRIVMLLADEPNIREIVLFPMNQQAQDLMMQAPSEVTMKQLRELHIRVHAPELDKKPS